MVDPYEFIVQESVVSSSQEELLKRIPGWLQQQESPGSPSPSSSPLPAALPLSRLCASGSSSDDEEPGPAPASAFCMQEPLEWASPEACQDDSYNPAFESDRSRSLSPLAPMHAYGDLWASRLITQSQNDVVMSHLGVYDSPLVGEAPKKNPQQAAEGVSRRLKPEHPRGTGGQLQNSRPVALSEVQNQVSVAPSTDIPNASHSTVELEKDCGKSKTSGNNGYVQKIVELTKTGPAVPLPSLSDHNNCVIVTVDEPGTEDAMLISRINSTAGGTTPSCTVANGRTQRDEEVECRGAAMAQKLKEPNYEQQHSKLANEANHNHHTVKGPQLKKRPGGDCVGGSSDAKCSLPFVCHDENISTHTMKMSTRGETEMVRDNVAMDGTVRRVFPESVMDVVMRVSETLPTPSRHDPDFLSIVMSTGVSLSLPFRDCSGRLISSKSVSVYKGSFSSGPT